jgi:hemolysin III
VSGFWGYTPARRREGNGDDRPTAWGDWAYRGDRRQAARRARERFRGYSLGEEIANAVTHGVGVLGSIVALVLLIIFAAGDRDPFRIASAITFGSALIFLYLSSTLYHSLRAPSAKRVFKILDHAAIYLLIAASYTPFTLVTLRGPWGWSIFAIVWTLAIAGIVTEAFWVDRPKWLSALVFIGMGWIVVVATKPLIESLPAGGLWLLLAGGLAYTLGTVFYILKRVPYFHAVWHLWVIGGSACHVLAVLLYVL